MPLRRGASARLGAFLIGLLVLGAIIGGSPAAVRSGNDGGTGSWLAVPDIPVPRVLHTATLLVDGTVLVAGGSSDCGRPAEGNTTFAAVFDPFTRRWTTTGPMTSPHQDPSATLLADGRVLVAGGGYGGACAYVTGVVELYDPASRTWSATGSLPMPRRGHVAVRLRDGRVLVAGGVVGDAPSTRLSATAEIYDPATGRWTPTGSMRDARGDHRAVLLPDGRVLVTGIGERSPSTAEIYDPATGTWSATANMGVPRSGHTATLLPTGKVLVVGGTGSDGPLASAELYDPAAGTWSPTGQMSTARSGHTATLLASGLVLVAGGCDRACSDDTHTSVELYDPATGTWVKAPAMITGHRNHTATLVRDGTVLVAGGWAGARVQGPSAAAELYRPAAPPAIPDMRPMTTAAVTPAPNASGWRNGPTTVVLTATAFGGATVARLTYWAAGAQSIPETTVAASTATVVIANNGATMLHYSAVDTAGREEPERTLAIWIQPTEWRLAPAQAVFRGAAINDVVFAAGRYIAVGRSAGRAAAWTSPDGLTWSRLRIVSAKGEMAALAAGHGRVVAVGAVGGRAAAWVSCDGRSWSRVGALPLPAGATTELRDVVATSTGFVAVGNAWRGSTPSAMALVSRDGIRWTRARRIPGYSPSDVGHNAMTGVIRGGPGLIAYGFASSVGPPELGLIWTSRDGLTWTKSPTVFRSGMSGNISLVFGAKPRWFALVVGDDPQRAFSSATGYRWTPIEMSGLTDRPRAAVRAAGAWFLVGTSQSGMPRWGVASWRSADGTTWTSIPMEQPAEVGFDAYATALASGPRGLVAVGYRVKYDDGASRFDYYGLVWVRPSSGP